MSEHIAKVSWVKQGEFSHESINRNHSIQFEENCSLQAAGANNGEVSDPEQMFAASLSSCHMQTFLILASKKRLVVESYEDEAIAVLEKNAEGVSHVSRVILTPKVVFSADTPVTKETLTKMHEKSHKHCFVANSINCEVKIQG